MSKKWKPGKNDKLVGRRIDPKTPLGAEIAKLRVMYACADQITMPESDRLRRMYETSLNVEAPLNLLAAKQINDQRKNLIRTRINMALEKCWNEHGQYPATIGIPTETLDEVREACYDYDVVFVPLEDNHG